jgi:hypothetical protein
VDNSSYFICAMASRGRDLVHSRGVHTRPSYSCDHCYPNTRDQGRESGLDPKQKHLYGVFLMWYIVRVCHFSKILKSLQFAEMLLI